MRILTENEIKHDDNYSMALYDDYTLDTFVIMCDECMELNTISINNLGNKDFCTNCNRELIYNKSHGWCE